MKLKGLSIIVLLQIALNFIDFHMLPLNFVDFSYSSSDFRRISGIPYTLLSEARLFRYRHDIFIYRLPPLPPTSLESKNGALDAGFLEFHFILWRFIGGM